MQKSLVLCLLLAAAACATAQGLPCPDGLVGPNCATCETDDACVALTNGTDSPKYWCYSNHTFTPETTTKSYSCDTEGTDFASSITNVHASCNTVVSKCDISFAISGYGLTCSGLQCKFEENGVFCGYTKCVCDGACPIVNGVSLGYMLERLTGQTALECEDGWPSALCTIDIQGLSATQGGFQAYCQAGECRA